MRWERHWSTGNVRISTANWFYWRQHRKSCRSTRRANSTSKYECGCSQVKGKSKTSTEGTCWDNNDTVTWKKMDWHWAIKARSRFVRSLEESDQSSSTQSDVTARRWSNWILQDKFHLRNHHSQIQNWSDDRWKACLAAGGGSKRRYQYCSDNLGTIIYLRALQGHSGSNLIDPTLQDNVLIGPGIFPYIYHVGSTFNLYSIVSNWLVPGGQHLSRRQTVFFLVVDPRNESHRDPEYIDFSVPRLARYMHKAWKRHQDAVFWVDIDLGIKEGLVFYQTRSNAIILQGTLPAHCIVKVERLKTGEKLYERQQYLSPRPPPKISLKHDLNWTKGNDQSGSDSWTSTSWKTRSTVTWRNTSTWFSQANPIP